MSGWRDNYVYVLPFALQSKTFTYHALPEEGSYFAPGCIGKNSHQAILILRSHAEAMGGTSCRKCHAKGERP